MAQKPPRQQPRQVEPEPARKMRKAQSLEECVKTAGSYWIRQVENPRWNIMISNFNGTIKVRIVTMTPNRGLVTLVNLNANRLDRALEILTKVKERLNQLDVKTNTVEVDDW